MLWSVGRRRIRRRGRLESSASDPRVQCITIPITRQEQNQKHQRQPRNDVLVKGVKRRFQQVPECHDDEDEAEAQEGGPRLESDDDQRAGDQLDEWNREADYPQRPRRKKRILKRQKVTAHMTGGPELEYLP